MAGVYEKPASKVATAEDEEQVLSALSLERFDVVFLDARFQNLAGRFGRQNAGVPIVGLDWRWMMDSFLPK